LPSIHKALGSIPSTEKKKKSVILLYTRNEQYLQSKNKRPKLVHWKLQDTTALLEEIKDQKTWDILYLWMRLHENSNSPQIHLESQCNPYPIFPLLVCKINKLILKFIRKYNWPRIVNIRKKEQRWKADSNQNDVSLVKNRHKKNPILANYFWQEYQDYWMGENIPFNNGAGTRDVHVQKNCLIPTS
jgi:hypothetical protein